MFVERSGERISTLDLFNGKWVLLSGPDSACWHEAARQTSAALALTLYHMGEDGDLKDIEKRWSSAYGVGADGAVLVRPDGFIAWRSHGAAQQPEKVLGDVQEWLSFR
jgi:putative polyketide hydroxylase